MHPQQPGPNSLDREPKSGLYHFSGQMPDLGLVGLRDFKIKFVGKILPRAF